MIQDERSRPDGCVTDLKFDAWFAHELASAARAELDAHVDGCARCRNRRAALSAEREAFLALQPHPQPRASSAAPYPGRLAFGTAALAAAAAIALSLWPSEPRIEPQVRTKGSAHLGFFVQRGGVSVRGVPGQAVHPGDRISFVYTSERPVYLAVYARDAEGTASVYFPAAATAQALPRAHDEVLETSVELDRVIGPETVFALFCDRGFQVAGPRRTLAATGALAKPPGCRIDTLTWNKESLP
jgi:Putative zinc-finger